MAKNYKKVHRLRFETTALLVPFFSLSKSRRVRNSLSDLSHDSGHNVLTLGYGLGRRSHDRVPQLPNILVQFVARVPRGIQYRGTGKTECVEHGGDCVAEGSEGIDASGCVVSAFLSRAPSRV